MKKYIKLFWVLAKQNIIAEMEFRQNFFTRFASQIFFVLLQIVIVDTYFQFTNSIGTWSKSEVFVLVGMFRLIEGGFHILFHSNLLTLPEMINEGELDGYLMKPANTLFLVSFRRHQWYELSTLLTGVLIIVYSLPGMNISTAVSIIVLAFLGLIAMYSIVTMFSTLSFFVPRLNAIGAFWDALSKSSRFPLDIFSSSTKTLFFLAPFSLVVTLPSQLILGKVSPLQWGIQIVGTAIILIAAYSFWKFALRSYSSASS